MASRGQDRVDLGRVRLALHAQDPAHDVNALSVPAAVDADALRAANGGRLPRLPRFGDPLLDVGVGGELRGLMEAFREPEGPGAGGDRHGDGAEVVRLAPGGGGETEPADLVSLVDAHRILRVGEIARRRGHSPVKRGSPSFGLDSVSFGLRPVDGAMSGGANVPAEEPGGLVPARIGRTDE